MSPATLARRLAGLGVRCGRPTAAQWVAALALLAQAARTPGHSLHVVFTPAGAARVTEHPLTDKPA